MKRKPYEVIVTANKISDKALDRCAKLIIELYNKHKSEDKKNIQEDDSDEKTKTKD